MEILNYRRFVSVCVCVTNVGHVRLVMLCVWRCLQGGFVFILSTKHPIVWKSKLLYCNGFNFTLVSLYLYTETIFWEAKKWHESNNNRFTVHFASAEQVMFHGDIMHIMCIITTSSPWRRYESNKALLLINKIELTSKGSLCSFQTRMNNAKLNTGEEFVCSVCVFCGCSQHVKSDWSL